MNVPNMRPNEAFLSHSSLDQEFVTVLSPNSVNSMWVKRELLFTLQQNRFDGKIVPLLHQNCNFDRLSWVLPSFQIISFQQDFDNGCRDLLRVWGIGYSPLG